MMYQLDLSDAWAKADRASIHVAQLRREMGDSGYAKGLYVPLHREYDRESQAIVVRIGDLAEPPQHWALVAGDAAHNLRAALDYLAWQLAVRKLGGIEPMDKRLARQIQFPIVSDRAKWADHPHRKHMLPDDLRVIEPMQPFNSQPDITLSALYRLSTLSDVDKHRRLHLAHLMLGGADFAIPSWDAFRDCTIRHADTPKGYEKDVLLSFPYPVRPNDEIIRILITPAGPNPDAEIEANLTLSVVVEERWQLLETLDVIGQLVVSVLNHFQPRPSARSGDLRVPGGGALVREE